MARFIAEKYRTVGTGELRTCSYHVVIRKKLVEDSGLDKAEVLKITQKGNKIIIEKGEKKND